MLLEKIFYNCACVGIAAFRIVSARLCVNSLRIGREVDLVE